MVVVKAVIAIAFCLALAKSIVVYERSGLADPYPSLKLKKSSILKATNFSLGLSICAGWKLNRIGGMIAIFQNPVQSLIFGVVGGHQEHQGLEFGNLHRQYVYEVDEDHKPESFFLNHWHHMCLSFNRKTDHLIVIQVLNFK